jgi:hypothetical protein
MDISNRISYDYNLAWEPHHINLYWDNDIVSLDRDECIKLIPVLQYFIENAK